MKAYQYFRALFRIWKPYHGPFKAARMALKAAIKPVPF